MTGDRQQEFDHAAHERGKRSRRELVYVENSEEEYQPSPRERLVRYLAGKFHEAVKYSDRLESQFNELVGIKKQEKPPFLDLTLYLFSKSNAIAELASERLGFKRTSFHEVPKVQAVMESREASNLVQTFDIEVRMWGRGYVSNHTLQRFRRMVLEDLSKWQPQVALLEDDEGVEITGNHMETIEDAVAAREEIEKAVEIANGLEMVLNEASFWATSKQRTKLLVKHLEHDPI